MRKQQGRRKGGTLTLQTLIWVHLWGGGLPCLALQESCLFITCTGEANVELSSLWPMPPFPFLMTASDSFEKCFLKKTFREVYTVPSTGYFFHLVVLQQYQRSYVIRIHFWSYSQNQDALMWGPFCPYGIEIQLGALCALPPIITRLHFALIKYG